MINVLVQFIIEHTTCPEPNLLYRQAAAGRTASIGNLIVTYISVDAVGRSYRMVATQVVVTDANRTVRSGIHSVKTIRYVVRYMKKFIMLYCPHTHIGIILLHTGAHLFCMGYARSPPRTAVTRCTRTRARR